jgi:hypothetical protein
MMKSAQAAKTSTMANRFKWWPILLVAIGMRAAVHAVPDVGEEDESGDHTLGYYVSKSFAVQQYNEGMVLMLKRLAKEE